MKLMLQAAVGLICFGILVDDSNASSLSVRLVQTNDLSRGLIYGVEVFAFPRLEGRFVDGRGDEHAIGPRGNMIAAESFSEAKEILVGDWRFETGSFGRPSTDSVTTFQVAEFRDEEVVTSPAVMLSPKQGDVVQSPLIIDWDVPLGSRPANSTLTYRGFLDAHSSFGSDQSATLTFYPKSLLTTSILSVQAGSINFLTASQLKTVGGQPPSRIDSVSVAVSSLTEQVFVNVVPEPSAFGVMLFIVVSQSLHRGRGSHVIAK